MGVGRALKRTSMFSCPNNLWWITNDSCGLFCAMFTMLLHAYAWVTTVVYLLIPWYDGSPLHVLLYTCSFVFAIVSHFRTQFSDPGAVPLHATPTSRSPETPLLHDTDSHLRTKIVPAAMKLIHPATCKRCLTVKPRGTHHCSICNRCIARMDHHCPWVNNCVAQFNQKFFILFLFYTAVCSLYCGGLLVTYFWRCTGGAQTMLNCHRLDPLHVLMFVFAATEAVMFGLFSTIMLYDQMSAIFENTPYIDSLQGHKGEKRGKMALLSEVFGEPLCWRWFVPISLPRRVFEEVEAELNEYRKGRPDDDE